MSFTSPPIGILRDNAEQGYAIGTRPPGDWESVGTGYTCPVSPGVTVDCVEGIEVTQSFSVDVTSTLTVYDNGSPGLVDPFVRDADYYTVAVALQGPVHFFGGHLGCGLQINGLGTCGPEAAPAQGWAVGGSYVHKGDWEAGDFGAPYVAGDAAASSGTASGEPDEIAAHLGGGSDFNISVLLVNPAPAWPSPDGYGNTFGRCLFTAAQIPATISTTISVLNAGLRVADPGAGELKVWLRRYYNALPSSYIVDGA